MKIRGSVLMAAALSLAACGGAEAPPPPPKAKEGRAETQSIRNTQAVGYDGKAIADKVDGALKANEEQARKTEAESEEK